MYIVITIRDGNYYVFHTEPTGSDVTDEYTLEQVLNSVTGAGHDVKNVLWKSTN